MADKTRDELEAMTKDELVNYANDRDIETQHSWLKDDIVSAILKGQKAAEQSVAEFVETSDEKPVEQTVEVDSELAALQGQANKPQDQSTIFAAGEPLKEKKHD